jgi:hypothetical protein
MLLMLSSSGLVQSLRLRLVTEPGFTMFIIEQAPNGRRCSRSATLSADSPASWVATRLGSPWGFLLSSGPLLVAGHLLLAGCLRLQVLSADKLLVFSLVAGWLVFLMVEGCGFRVAVAVDWLLVSGNSCSVRAAQVAAVGGGWLLTVLSASGRVLGEVSVPSGC